ncbi:MFS transporter [Rhodococcus qingshengii]|uniref:MFS transporter n=1 Tax=Rhodococcus qingshengii TaxID=334542 RepID=UPI001C246795|nr:MFS transporter [Rhodococcus qingshengii]QXC46873.1 MFS transporter [Rhodococcus qingshengii]
MSTSAMIATRRWYFMIPVVAVMYLLAYLDRGNVALILPYVGEDLHLSSSAKGLASGLFFLGYLVLQVPSVFLARRWGARPTVAWLLVGWSAAATACGFVTNEFQLYLARFALGVFEGGVLPVVILLLTRWFVESERSRANTLFLTCLPLSAVIASPFTGWLLGITDWRTVFIIEGLMPLVWLIPWLLLVRERPTDARWLSASESGKLQAVLDAEQESKKATAEIRYREVLRNTTVWRLIIMYFLWFAGGYGVVLWLPTAIKAAISPNSSALHVGTLSAIPYAVAVAGMVMVGRYCSRYGSTRQWIIPPLIASGIALAAGQFVSNVPMQILLLSIVATGSYMSVGVLLSVPSSLFPEGFAGVTVAAMTTFGSVGGFVGPFAVGWLSDIAGSTVPGFLALAASFLAAAAIAANTLPRNKSGTTPPKQPHLEYIRSQTD